MVQHVDPDRLAQLALDEPGDDEADDALVAAHLDACPTCRAEYDALRDTVTIVRDSSVRPQDITRPPERVWRGISDELDIDIDAEAAGRPEADVVALPRHRRWVLAAVAVVAGVLGIAGTLAVGQMVDDDGDAPSPVGDVALDPLPTGPQEVSGQATVTVASGTTELEVSTRGLDDPADGFYEVWVIDPDDLTRMYSLGALGSRADGLFTVPPNVDLERFSVVDISIEPVDGDPTHSTNSVLRGVLPTS